MKVYIVEGQTGEYSDRRVWPVCGYLSEAAARAKVGRLEQNLREAVVKWGEDAVRYASIWNKDEPQSKEIIEFIGDPNYMGDYTGTRYRMYVVDIVDLGWPESSSTQ